jgi:hypothetical protein
MEKKEITVSNLIPFTGITVVPIAKVLIDARHGKLGTAFYGSIQPDSVIIITPQGKRAFRINGEEVAFEQLAQELPDISEKLAEI